MAPTEPPPDGTADTVTVPRKALAGVAAALLALAAIVAGLAGVDLADLPGYPTDPTTTTAPTSTSTSTPPPPADRFGINPAGLDHYDDSAGVSAADVDRLGMTHPVWTESTAAIGIPQTNGRHPDGQFRLNCHASHWSYDDPVVFPDQPGRAHLHMFFGNTTAAASSSADSLLAAGGSSCQGNVNNRSAYWMPALVDGDGNTLPPELIVLYYKSKTPEAVVAFPHGTQLLAGLEADGVARETIRPGSGIVWGCYAPSSGLTVQQSTTIPGAGSAPPCPPGWPIALDIQFPECMAVAGDGTPRVTSANLIDHTLQPSGGVGQRSTPCPADYPVQLPQITYKVRWSNPGPGVADWRLSCDHDHDGDGAVDHPGGCAHADWLGAWSPTANDAWLAGCFRPVSFNCSQGQTGGPRSFARFTGEHVGTGARNQLYTGPAELPIPQR